MRCWRLRDLSDRYGHLQEIIIQNFRAKPGTKMQHAPEPSNDELCWTIAVARLMFGAQMSIQAPPNLYGGDLTELIAAGINDWGGVSPLTPDHVNPEAPWPHLDRLAAETARAGCDLVERLTVYPRYVRRRDEWLADELHAPVLRLSDAAGWARVGRLVRWQPLSRRIVMTFAMCRCPAMRQRRHNDARVPAVAGPRACR